MRAKTIVTTVLLLFVAASVAFLVAREARDDEPASTASESEAVEANEPHDAGQNENRSGGSPVDEVIVYYFHGNSRCVTCRKIEAYAEEAVRTNFADELASGKVKWRAVNVDQPENAHFIQDYRLVTRSVVLVGNDKDHVQQKWKNLDKVWQHVRVKPQFADYIVDNARDFMAGGDG